MKIVVLNGSPKGKYSITLQYIKLLRKKFKEHEFQVINISKRIKKIEKDEAFFLQIIEAVKTSNVVIWSFGLWILSVPAQYMRFIELITERKAKAAFRNKYTAAISTSIHYYDHAAHNYMRAVCEDLKMKYIDGISLDIYDMLKEKRREQLTYFAENLFDSIGKRRITTTLFNPLSFNHFKYKPGKPASKIDSQGQKILVLTDAESTGSNLQKMTNRFKASFFDEVEEINLHDVKIKGACLGCMKCGYDYHCQYKDEFTDFYNNRVRPADIIVFAGSVKGRYLSSRWKTFYDRSFFWNHTPSLAGKQMAYIISGPLSQNQNLVQVLEAMVTDRQESNLVDIITDENENAAEIDAQIQNLGHRMVQFSVKKYIRPFNFLAVGGHKIFRDDIWGRLRSIWQADHRYYKKHGLYDFPHKDIKTRIMNPLVMLATKIPSVRKKYYDNMMKFPAQRFGKLADKLAQEDNL